MSPRKENLTLDSAYFVAFEMTHDALKRGLKSASELSITQYRMLVKLAAAGGKTAQADLGRILDLKPNVVTQAANALEEAGFARRETDDADARSKSITATQNGISHVASVNRSIVACLYALFPTEDASWRAILETSIDACSHIDPPVSEREATDYPASRALAALERFRIAIEARLRQACGASFSECRVMQLLDEAQRPLRIGDIAAQLRLSTVNVARAVDRLSDRNWVRRMGASHDRKAVFVNVTDEGFEKQRVIARMIDDLGRSLLWKHLDRAERTAVREVTRTVIEGLRLREYEKGLTPIDELHPLGKTPARR